MLPTFELFGQTIHTGDIFLFLHYPGVPFIYLLLRKRYGFPVKKTLFYAFFTLFFGVGGAIVTSKVANYVLTVTSHGAFEPYETLNSYGIAMFLAVIYIFYCLLFRKPFQTLTDYAMPAVSFIHVLGKLVCVFNGCCYGPASEHGLYFQNLGYKAVPVQLYDTINNAIIFVILIVLTYTFSKKHKGYLYPIAGILYAIQKWVLEEFRVYENPYEGNFLNTGWTFWQWFLVILFVGSVIWLIGAILWEKKGMPDLDTVENIKLPDLSKIPEKIKARKQKNKRTYTHHNKKKK